MKKILLVLSLMIASLVNVNAQGTYRGFVDVGPSIGNGFSIDITTAHGWQFNQNWFLGAGIGAINCIETYNYQYYGDGGKESYEGISLPIFAKVRFDNLGEKSLTFFAEANLGYSIVASYGDSDNPLYASLAVGLRKRLTERIGLNYGIGFSIVPSYYCDYSDCDEGGDSAFKFNVKVGIDF